MLSMRLRTEHAARTLLQNAFGPTGWQGRCARVLGVDYRYVLELAAGRSPLTREHIRTMRNYLRNRKPTKGTEFKREVERVRILYDRAHQGWSAAELEVISLDAEFSRTIKKTR